MMEASAERLVQRGLKTHLIAVTVLTSMSDDELQEIGVSGDALAQVERLARLTQESGLDGVVCSARESARLTELCGEAFLKVTPGIRPATADQGDQRRVMTPEAAMAAGSTHLVIGRAITQAAEPMSALAEIECSLSRQ
jgi:orotidine-5'-phosphate decarboxylase